MAPFSLLLPLSLKASYYLILETISCQWWVFSQLWGQGSSTMVWNRSPNEMVGSYCYWKSTKQWQLRHSISWSHKLWCFRSTRVGVSNTHKGCKRAKIELLNNSFYSVFSWWQYNSLWVSPIFGPTTADRWYSNTHWLQEDETSNQGEVISLVQKVGQTIQELERFLSATTALVQSHQGYYSKFKKL